MNTSLDVFEGHIVLYCKNHYNFVDIDIDFITGLQRIWAFRCGYPIEAIDSSSLEYIANALYRIIKKTKPEKLEYLFELIHKDISKDYLVSNQNLKSIEKLIFIYRSELIDLTIFNGNVPLIKLPISNKKLFKRILNGEATSKDYKLLNE